MLEVELVGEIGCEGYCGGKILNVMRPLAVRERESQLIRCKADKKDQPPWNVDHISSFKDCLNWLCLRCGRKSRKVLDPNRKLTSLDFSMHSS